MSAETAEPPTGPPARLRWLPSWLLNHLALRATRVVGDHLGRLGVRTEYKTLAGLAEFGTVSQADLGRLLGGMDRSDVAGVLTKLEKDGFVARVADPADRRRNAVTITAAGSRELERLQVRLDEAQDALMAPLTAAQREQLIGLLQIMVDHYAAAPKCSATRSERAD
jgi:DNA-binding MarR family transcriptional regulator